MIEREKKWYINGSLPEEYKEKYLIEQTYASFNPDVRIRKTIKKNQTKFTHTVKYKVRLNERQELIQEISEEVYNDIFNSINKKPIRKERIVFELANGLFAEVDRFLDTGESVVEVEFPTQQSERQFVKPEWFGQEIKSESFNHKVFSRINNILWS